MTPDLNERSATSPEDHLPTHPRRKGLQILIWCLLLLAFIYAGVLIYRGQGESVKMAAPARTAPGITITTVTAQKGDIGVYLDSIGTVTPVYTDSITSQVNGLVVAVHFKEGQRSIKAIP